VVIKKN